MSATRRRACAAPARSRPAGPGRPAPPRRGSAARSGGDCRAAWASLSVKITEPSHPALLAHRARPRRKLLSVFCYRLDPTTSTYASAGVHTGKMTVTEPVAVTIDLTALLGARDS
jgi:hypothetical protein